MIDTTPWASRPRPGPPPVPLELSDDDRTLLKAQLRLPTVEKRIFLRGQALLMFADGATASDVSTRLGVHLRTAKKWRKRFRRDKPLERLKDAPRPGRPPSLSRTPTARKS